MSKTIKIFSTLCFLCIFLYPMSDTFSYAQDQQKNDTFNQAHSDHSVNQTKSDQEHEHNSPTINGEITASFDDFPNLHPLLVHFPIVLLLLAALLAVLNIFFVKIELDWVLTLCIGFGALGAYAAGKWFHPHAHNLTEHAQAVFDQHELYADWTIWLSIAAFVLQLISQFIIKQKRWAVVVVAVILTGAAYTVSRAGHYGSQLVYIEGVGPQGRYLESDEEHSH